MESISNLINDDPWLKMPKGERIALRRQRREKLRPMLGESVVLPMFIAPEIIEAEPAKPSQAEIIAAWVERQRAIPVPVANIRAPKILTGDIQRAVSSHYGIPLPTLFGASRLAKIVLPRQVAYYLVRVMTGNSMPDIGRRFGGRDHTTILHSVRKIQRMMAFDEKFKANVDSLRAKIEENFI